MDYSGINAKIKAMRGNLLNTGDYARLCQADSVDSAARTLSEYPAYRAAMSRALNAEIHRDIVEQKILLSLSDDFKRIYNFISDFSIRKYMNAYFLSFELGIIKTLLCMVYDERDINYSVPELNLLIGSELRIDTASLKASKNPEEFIRNLRGAGFYSMLTDAFTSRSSLFDIEMQLDLYYYMNLWKRQRQYLDTKNRRLMERISGSEIDLRNIMWVYRLKKYYNLDNSRIYAYLIPISYRLPRARLMRMVQCPSVDALIAEIESSPYGAVFDDFSGLERSYYKRMSKMYSFASMTSTQSLAYTTGFVYLKELELKNLISLLEGVRYKLKPGDIMSYLNLPREAEAR
ncbi:MAG: V-type ATPase subunit [Clostridiales bacterium]|jgi:V/A-type H+-transporting ATPase subunit C|nr:V-type ATPase subunit [Clostridiales bacterium]